MKHKNAREDFKKMLEESTELTSSTRWSKAAPLFENDVRFKAVERDKDRRDLFDSFMEELQNKSRPSSFGSFLRRDFTIAALSSFKPAGGGDGLSGGGSIEERRCRFPLLPLPCCRSSSSVSSSSRMRLSVIAPNRRRRIKKVSVQTN
ncbi:hypothetical protein K1719_014759 [Acacia pycnantha]|nr:hypothetical protein K1719_014759 [Acacia pycnantha]